MFSSFFFSCAVRPVPKSERLLSIRLGDTLDVAHHLYNSGFRNEPVVAYAYTRPSQPSREDLPILKGPPEFQLLLLCGCTGEVPRWHFLSQICLAAGEGFFMDAHNVKKGGTSIETLHSSC